jgi:hypothetical protein
VVAEICEDEMTQAVGPRGKHRPAGAVRQAVMRPWFAKLAEQLDTVAADAQQWR